MCSGLWVVDVGLLVIVWAVALAVGGDVALRIAQLGTLLGSVLLLVGAVLRRIPHGRPDEAYLTSVRRALSASRPPSQAVNQPASRGRVARHVYLCVAAVMLIVVQAAFARAPSTSSLPIARADQVIASVSGGSQIDTANDRDRYRYIAIAGPPGATRATAFDDEIAKLISSHWVCTSQKLVHLKPRGATYELIPGPCLTEPTQDPTLLSISHGIRVDLTTVTNQADANQETDGTTLERSHAIQQALHNGRPVLWATLTQTG